jgi:hypothetical protein
MAKSQTEQNTADIAEIKTDIKIIRDNHLKHIEKDMCKQSKIIDKLDNRLWWVLGLLVASTVAGMVGEYML